MEKYIKYSYYDETGKKIAVIYKDIDKNIMQDILSKYDGVEYEE